MPQSRRMLTSAARMAERWQHPSEWSPGWAERTSGEGVRAVPNRRSKPKETAFHSACASGFPEKASPCASGFTENGGPCASGFLEKGGPCASGFLEKGGPCASGFPEEFRS